MLDDGKDTMIDLVCRLIGISVLGSEIAGYVVSLTLIVAVLVYEHRKRRKANERRGSNQVSTNPPSQATPGNRYYDAQAIGEDGG